jgi:hypothetical protein
MPIQKSCNERF